MSEKQFLKNVVRFYNKYCPPLQRIIPLKNIYFYLSENKVLIGFKSKKESSIFLLKDSRVADCDNNADSCLVENKCFEKIVVDGSCGEIINPKLNKNYKIENMLREFCLSALSVEQIFEKINNKKYFFKNDEIVSNNMKTIYEICCLESDIQQLLQKQNKKESIELIK